MSLTIEDGTGGDCMITLGDFKTYCTNYGYDLSLFTNDALIEQAIRRASNYLTNSFSFKGYRIGNRNQIQAWPRNSVTTEEGWYVSSASIPREVSWANAEAAWYELNNPNGLLPTVTLTDRVTHEQVGPISVSYANTGTGTSASKPVLTVISDLLSQLLTCGSGANVTARADRG